MIVYNTVPFFITKSHRCEEMNIYVYNSSTINEYSADDCGLILSSPIEVLDCGGIVETYNYIEDCYTINCSETLHPFGSIKISNSNSKQTCYKKVSSEFVRFENLNNKSIILTGIIITWYGYGTLFEINDGLIRQVVPDVSGGGIV